MKMMALVWACCMIDSCFLDVIFRYMISTVAAGPLGLDAMIRWRFNRGPCWASSSLNQSVNLLSVYTSGNLPWIYHYQKCHECLTSISQRRGLATVPLPCHLPRSPFSESPKTGSSLGFGTLHTFSKSPPRNKIPLSPTISPHHSKSLQPNLRQRLSRILSLNTMSFPGR